MDIELSKVGKYVGSCCGNSFIILDCRNIKLDKQAKADFSSKNIITYNVDSALFIGNTEGFDISLEIFEKDGSESDSCGNGIILVSYLLGLDKGRVKMKNSIVITESNEKSLSILMYLKSSYIKKIEEKEKCLFIKMGEPHVVFLVDDLNKFDLVKIGEKLQKKYLGGVNVDVIQKKNEFRYLIRTYERGVFNETKSCGTGSLSSFIAISHFNNIVYNEAIEFSSIGGSHWVSRVGGMLKLETLKEFCKIQALD